MSEATIDESLEREIRSWNPWWAGKPGRILPPFRRWAFKPLLRKIDIRLSPIVVLRGARQVGKTTLQEQIVEFLLTERRIDPRRIFRVQFDQIRSIRAIESMADPILHLTHWYERAVLGETLNEAAHRAQPAYLFFDEAQELDCWAPQLKSLVDHNTVHVMATGSSAFQIAAGQDSLAGRITMMEMGTLLLREIAAIRSGAHVEPLMPENGLRPLLEMEFWREIDRNGARHAESRNDAFAAFSERGGYPIAHVGVEMTWPEIADKLNDDVIRRALRHDLRLEESGRRLSEQLVDEVFRLVCRYAGQSPTKETMVEQLRDSLKTSIRWPQASDCLERLERAMLIRMIRPMELRLRRTGSSSKLCVVDHALRASWLEETIPIDPQALLASPQSADLAGRIAESVVGIFLSGLLHLDLVHFPKRADEAEVDYVLRIGDKNIPLEVKYRRRIDPLRDTVGLRSFLEKVHYNAPFGVLVTMEDETEVVDPRIVTVSLRSLLLMR
jgi:predicted AAA+ superfamily ATPase